MRWTSTFHPHLPSVNTVYGGRVPPNKTHLFTRHFSALHTVLQPTKDGAEGIRRQILLAWRHQVHHIPERLFHSGGSRCRNKQTPTGQEQQPRTRHVWNLEGWKVISCKEKQSQVEAEWLSGFFCRSIKLQSSAHSLNHFRCTWALHGDWLRGGLWSPIPVGQTYVCSHLNSQIISEADDNENNNKQK